jgi:hypothetical protein
MAFVKGQKPPGAVPNWKKGQSGNPGGRPKEIAIALAMASRVSIECIEYLVKVLKDEDIPVATRIEAAKVLLDRGLGKPQQQTDLSITGAPGRLIILPPEDKEP